MSLRNANGVHPTWQGAARVDTDVVFTSQLSRTVVILVAFSSSRSDTSSGVRISSGSLWTLTLVAARFIETSCFKTTRIIGTLVDVLTTCQRVTGRSGLAQALRWITGCTFRIEATSELVTRTSASVTLTDIGKVWWQADTHSGIQALFVLPTLGV